MSIHIRSSARGLLNRALSANRQRASPQFQQAAALHQIHNLIPAAEINLKEPTFDKILIANRGEIACRVIHTAKKMGIKTVAVYSEADARSLFVRMADETVFIGPPPVNQSYIVMEKILNAVKSTGANAVHPGYGFLSENTHFVAELEREGVKFIGPNSPAIRDMGDKLASKRLATKAKVNGIPGFDGVIEDVDHCVKLSNEIGYPVMIKASAGGGGKGMRVAFNDDEAREAFTLCSEESRSSFGDDRMLVEKFVNKPRHVEIQVLGDKHGNCIYLNERECSIQRRNQKVIEEAPSPFLDPATRKAMGEQAVSLAKAIGYDSAGTVEFLLDDKKNFFFLEMNTRLQVEHPITESITGVDLVHQMIRSAYGHKLELTQDDIGINGWAIECRIYAEDPYKNFGMPSIGRLNSYQEPNHIPGVRCDSGIDEGSEISMYYDPMICKLTCRGKDRKEAIDTSVNALDHYVIRGVTHNIPLLRDILREPVFNSGTFTTNYLPETYPEGFKGVKLTQDDKRNLAAIASVFYVQEELRLHRGAAPPRNDYKLEVKIGEDKMVLDLDNSDADSYSFRFDDGAESTLKKGMDQWDKVSVAKFGNGNDHVVQLISQKQGNIYRIRYAGTALDISVIPEHIAKYEKHMKEKPKLDATKIVMAPMPGTVKTVAVSVGQMIGEGTECCVLEAMKMQNSLKSGASGKVKAVNVKPGDTVQADQVLIEIE